MNTSEVLYEAANVIERRGWVNVRSGQDPWGGGAGSSQPVCLEGGIAAAMGLVIPPLEAFGEESNVERNAVLYELSACPAYVAVADYLQDRPFRFNDKIGRTEREVIETLRAAAVIEEAREADPIIAGALAQDFHEVRAAVSA